jgi:hypothetical protein
MNWKELLKRMKLEYIKKKSPSFFELSGGYAMKVKAYSDKDANNLTRSIEDFINFLPNGQGEAFRCNVMGTPRKKGGKLVFTKSNTRKGVADIRGTYKGRSLSIEVKINDRQSEAQIGSRRFILHCKEHGFFP